MLTSIHIQGFKSIKNTTINLDPITLFVGPNGSGKTSALDALLFLWEAISDEKNKIQQQIKRPRSRILMEEPTPLNINNQTIKTENSHQNYNSTQQLKIENLFTSPKTDKISIKPTPLKNSHEILASKNSVIARNSSQKIQISSPYKNPELREEFSAWPEKATNPELFKKTPSPIKLSLSSNTLSQNSPAMAETPFLTKSGENLPTVLNYLISRRDGTIESIEKDMQKIVKNFERIYTEPTSIYSEKTKISGYALEISFKNIGRVPAHHVSEGTLLALGLLTFMHTQQSNIILMDDVDRGLHPAAQQTLVQILKKLQKEHKIQLILTTHSPDLINEFLPEEVRVFGQNKEGYTVVRSLTEHPEANKWLDMMRAGEFWSTVGEDWVAETSESKHLNNP